MLPALAGKNSCPLSHRKILAVVLVFNLLALWYTKNSFFLANFLSWIWDRVEWLELAFLVCLVTLNLLSSPWFASDVSDSVSLLTIDSFSCFFMHLRIFYWLLDTLCRAAEAKIHSIYAWKGTYLFCQMLCQSRQKLSWGLVWLVLWSPPAASPLWTVTLCLGWRRGCWKGFLFCSCSMLNVEPRLCSCASEGGCCPCSGSSPSRRLLLLIAQCLLGWWRVWKGFSVSKASLCLKQAQCCWSLGMVFSIFLSSPPVVCIYRRSCAAVSGPFWSFISRGCRDQDCVLPSRKKF